MSGPGSPGPDGPLGPGADALAAWSALAGGWPVELGPAWLQAEWGRVTPRCGVAWTGRAAASWMRVDGSEVRTGYTAFDLLLDPDLDEALRDAGGGGGDVARERAAALRRAPTVTVATSSAYLPGIVFDRALDAGTAADAVREVVGRVCRAARDAGAAVVAVANVPDPLDDPTFAPVHAALEGAIRATTAPHAELRIPADGFTGLVSSLRPSVRSSVRRERARFLAEASIAEHGAERLRAPDLAALLAAQYGKYGHAAPDDAIRDRLARVVSFGGDLRVLVAECGGAGARAEPAGGGRRVVGFAALVLDRGHRRLVPRLLATADRDGAAYFNLTFHEPVARGAATGFEALALGTTSYKAKLLRGARLFPRTTYLIPLEPGLHEVLVEAAAFRTDAERARRAALAAFER